MGELLENHSQRTTSLCSYFSTMAPNENNGSVRVQTTYKVADKAMDIPVVNDVLSGMKKMTDPIAPYVEETYNILKDKAKESLSEEVKEKVESTLGSLGSTIDNLACNGLDQLTTAVPSLQTVTTPELMENTKEAAVSAVDAAQEYLASFKVARFGIRVFDAYLSVIEAPLSVLSSSASSKVQGVRRHLRAVRRAGARRDGEPCNDGPLLMEMSKVFKLNVLLGFLGMQLVKIEEPRKAATSPLKSEKVSASDSEEEDDPDYVPENRESDDSLEYRSDAEATQESQDDGLEIVAELVDCPTTPDCKKVEHTTFKDLVKEEPGESEDSDPEIEEVQEVGSECNTPACEKPKHQLLTEDVVAKALDNELEDNLEEVEVAELEDCPTTPNCEKFEHKKKKEVAPEGNEGSSSSDDDLN